MRMMMMIPMRWIHDMVIWIVYVTLKLFSQKYFYCFVVLVHPGVCTGMYDLSEFGTDDKLWQL
jgi:hypothetical protein